VIRRAILQFFSLVLLSAAVLIPATAEAQFLQTDVNTYQLPDPKREVVVITTPKGLFFAQTFSRTSSLASFDPEQLVSNETLSLFLGYAANTKVPDRLILPGNDVQYKIRGTFTVAVAPSIRISVAMNPTGVPYVSIVNAEKGAEAILGFVGQQLVVNLAGTSAVELLEADTMRRQFGDAAAPYQLESGNELKLLQRPVPSGSFVGLLTPSDNPCLLEDAKLRWEGSDDPKKPGKKRVSNLSSFLVLNTSADLIVGVHFDSGKFVAIATTDTNGEKSCNVRPLQLDDKQKQQKPN